MLSAAKVRFLVSMLECPIEKPTGYAGGQAGWEHNARHFEDEGLAEITITDYGSRCFAALTPLGELQAAYLLKLKKRGRGRPTRSSGRFEDLSPLAQFRLKEKWAEIAKSNPTHCPK